MCIEIMNTISTQLICKMRLISVCMNIIWLISCWLHLYGLWLTLCKWLPVSISLLLVQMYICNLSFFWLVTGYWESAIYAVYLSHNILYKQGAFFPCFLIQAPGQGPGDHRSSAASGDQSLGPDRGQT